MVHSSILIVGKLGLNSGILSSHFIFLFSLQKSSKEWMNYFKPGSKLFRVNSIHHYLSKKIATLWNFFCPQIIVVVQCNQYAIDLVSTSCCLSKWKKVCNSNLDSRFLYIFIYVLVKNIRHRIVLILPKYTFSLGWILLVPRDQTQYLHQ